MIGDVALDWAGPEQRLDLGRGVEARYGLPFVTRSGPARSAPSPPITLPRCRAPWAAAAGAAAEIASSYNGHGPARAALYEAYLRDNIVYALGEDEQAGLREFYRRAHHLDLIPAVPELRFHGHP